MRFRPRTESAPLLLLAALAGCSGGVSGPPDPGGPPPPSCAATFANPVAPGADPWVVRHAGAYYLIESRDNAIWVYRSTDLTRPKQNGVRVWSSPASGWNRSNVWAPELHQIDGRWYIYYAAGEAGPPFIHQRSGVLESLGNDPQGLYADKGRLDTGGSLATHDDDLWAIDVTVARLNGELYAVWSGWEQSATTDRTPQHTYIARMANPWTMETERVRISSPIESWERGTELDLQEGAEFLLRDGRVFLVYSTRESWLRDYRLGLLRLAAPTADPLQPESWTKSGPVFAGTNDVFGVGHASFTTSPDGTQDWIVYHSKVSTTPGWDRVIRMQPFTWNPDGTPNFGTPVPSAQQLAVPAGQCPAS